MKQKFKKRQYLVEPYNTEETQKLSKQNILEDLIKDLELFKNDVSKII